jgi:two-component system nitrogen regulation sensor histidine kinase GlnL
MVLNAIQHPVIMVDAEGVVCFANWEAESFFRRQRRASEPAQA